MLASQVPIAVGLTTGLGYTPSHGDTCQIFNQANNGGLGGYNLYNYTIPKGQTTNSWQPSEPIIGVGQGFFVNTTNKNATLNTTFVVQ
jgi:hypothetical protein